MVAIPRHQTKRAMRNSSGALQILRRSPNTIMLVRKMNNFSIADSDIAFPRRTNQRCCAKQIPVLAVSEALKMVVKRMDTAEAWDCVK
jgi:hypothetical protein